MGAGLAATMRRALRGSPIQWYLVVQLSLAVLAQTVPSRSSGGLNVIVVTVGSVVLTVALIRKRPRPLVGWSLVALSGWTQVLGAVAATAVYGLGPDVVVGAAFLLVLSIAPYPFLAGGLGVLSWVTPRRGPADVLDASITALALFLVLWAAFLGRLFALDVPAAAVIIGIPLGLLVVLTFAVKVMLGGGLSDPPVAILLVSVGTLLTAIVLFLVPGAATRVIRVDFWIEILWTAYGVLLGLIGLVRALDRPRRRVHSPSDDTSPRRSVLFALLALVPSVVWVVEAYGPDPNGADDVVEVGVPATFSALLLLLLVVRMGLIARVAQRQATQLAGRSQALAAAVSEQEELQSELSYRATHDPLTRLSNRTVLIDELTRLLGHQAQRHALLLFDLDRFKDVNDTFGHPVGDELLVQVGQRLRESAPAGALLARLGGDEFAIVLAGTEAVAAREYGDVLLRALRRTYRIGPQEILLTVSIGLFTTDGPTGPLTPAEALGDADLALYAAKQKGGDQVAEFRPSLRAARMTHNRLTSGLRRAVADNEFRLQYQPLVDLATGDVMAVEALLRWRPPDGPLLYPADFLAIAEEAGLTGSIGEWVLRQACADVRPWYHRYGVAVSVNTAVRQLEEARLEQSILDKLAAAGLPGRALILEITEDSLIATTPHNAVHARLGHLRDHGIRIAIDDFGTGYSSLSYVAYLPIDIVKIDKSVIQAHGSQMSPRHREFTRAVLQLVDSLGLAAVAEGVESAEQARALRGLRCAFGQGYYFSPPVDATAIDRLLARAHVASG